MAYVRIYMRYDSSSDVISSRIARTGRKVINRREASNMHRMPRFRMSEMPETVGKKAKTREFSRISVKNSSEWFF
jgi:hypothetical protein